MSQAWVCLVLIALLAAAMAVLGHREAPQPVPVKRIVVMPPEAR